MNIERQKPRDEAIEKIENYIIQNHLKPGDRLPSERSMCDMWDFNRSTLRSAIKQLILEGKIYNKNGSGTYVSGEKLVRNLQDTDGFYQTVKRSGREITTKVVHMDFCETPKNIGRKMKLPLGHKLFRLVRIRYLDGIPVMISTAFLDAERFPGLEALDFENNSLYSLLKQHYNVEISGGHEKLSITYCDAQEAGYLEMEEGAPVIYQSGVTMDEKDVVFEYFKEITRSEYICYASELTRR